MIFRTEDEVRDSAKLILGFDKAEPKVKQGTGQITTFNQLGFKGVIDKPDGWYLPDDKGIPAIIFSLADSLIASVMAVSIIPGATALTLIFLPASSLARDFVMPITAALLAA